jgi:hypothetical protein
VRVHGHLPSDHFRRRIIIPDLASPAEAGWAKAGNR